MYIIYNNDDCFHCSNIIIMRMMIIIMICNIRKVRYICNRIYNNGASNCIFFIIYIIMLHTRIIIMQNSIKMINNVQLPASS